MEKKVYSLKFRMIISLLPLLLLGMVIVGMFIINYLTSSALNKQLYANLHSQAKIAAATTRTGLEFEDNETVASALKAFTEDEQLAYLKVINQKGEAVYKYRKSGLDEINPDISDDILEIGDEVFVSNKVTSGDQDLGRVVLSLSLESRNNALDYSKTFLLILSIIGLGVLGVVVYFAANSISRPLVELVRVAESISEGDLQQEINITGTMEVVKLAAGFESVLGYILQISHLADEVSNGDLRSEVNVRSERDTLSLSFDKLMSQLRQIFTDIRNFSGQLSDASGQLLDMSAGMSTNSQELSQASNTVASATEEMNVNISTISTNAQEMSSTVAEIARNTEEARYITDKAVKTTEEASRQMTDLKNASLEINKVTEVIADIAEQTKLLALNATIEAARAGEAGKGFAVVASEVKDLAQQTNIATEDIIKRLNAMQQNTNNAVNGIEQISNVIKEVNDMVAVIASAVEEQQVTVTDIAENIGQSANASQNIASDMVKYQRSSEVVQENSNRLQGNAEGLKQINEKQQKLIEQRELKLEKLQGLIMKPKSRLLRFIPSRNGKHGIFLFTLDQ